MMIWPHSSTSMSVLHSLRKCLWIRSKRSGQISSKAMMVDPSTSDVRSWSSLSRTSISESFSICSQSGSRWYSLGSACAAHFRTYGDISTAAWLTAICTMGMMTSTRIDERTRRALARISWFGSFSPFWKLEIESSAMSGSSSAYRTTYWYTSFRSSTDLATTFLTTVGKRSERSSPIAISLITSRISFSFCLGSPMSRICFRSLGILPEPTRLLARSRRDDRRSVGEIRAESLPKPSAPIIPALECASTACAMMLLDHEVTDARERHRLYPLSTAQNG
mmetsp:Transcript_36337/g.95203  ORF Transcript_36337/g.95203 Transcript_36337/m.95203 type:complete len:279 (-) Transcript_36337:60-896(-)